SNTIGHHHVTSLEINGITSINHTYYTQPPNMFHTISSITLLPSYYAFHSFHTLGSPKVRAKEKTKPKGFAQRTLFARRDRMVSHNAPP
ncbi:hypothetical protein VIGAN_06224700, partial [Vigna angularis var. angularis]